MFLISYFSLTLLQLLKKLSDIFNKGVYIAAYHYYGGTFIVDQGFVAF